MIASARIGIMARMRITADHAALLIRCAGMMAGYSSHSVTNSELAWMCTAS